MATTWSEDQLVQDKARVAKAVCTTGTESAPTQSSAEGLLLAGLAGYSVFIESAAAAFTPASLDAYLQNPLSGKWSRRRDMDLAVGAVMNDSFGGFEVQGRVGRLALVPNGVGQASTIYLVGHYKEGLR